MGDGWGASVAADTRTTRPPARPWRRVTIGAERRVTSWGGNGSSGYLRRQLRQAGDHPVPRKRSTSRRRAAIPGGRRAVAEGQRLTPMKSPRRRGRHRRASPTPRGRWRRRRRSPAPQVEWMPRVAQGHPDGLRPGAHPGRRGQRGARRAGSSRRAEGPPGVAGASSDAMRAGGPPRPRRSARARGTRADRPGRGGSAYREASYRRHGRRVALDPLTTQPERGLAAPARAGPRAGSTRGTVRHHAHDAAHRAPRDALCAAVAGHQEAALGMDAGDQAGEASASVGRICAAALRRDDGGDLAGRAAGGPLRQRASSEERVEAAVRASGARISRAGCGRSRRGGYGPRAQPDPAATTATCRRQGARRGAGVGAGVTRRAPARSRWRG